MIPRPVLRPTRSHALPFLVVLFPLLWFVLGEVHTAAVRPSGEALPVAAVVTAVTGAILASHLPAVVVVTALGVRTSPPSNRYLHGAFYPTDATLRVVAVVLAGIGAYFGAALLIPIPGVVDALLAPFGFALGWPLVASVVLLTVGGNALSVEPAMAIQELVVGGALSVTAVWTFYLATKLSQVLGGSSSVPSSADE